MFKIAISLQLAEIINILLHLLQTYDLNLTLHLKNPSSDKYHTLLMRLFYKYEFLQKRQSYHNIAFIIYTKPYLLLLFLGS